MKITVLHFPSRRQVFKSGDGFLKRQIHVRRSVSTLRFAPATDERFTISSKLGNHPYMVYEPAHDLTVRTVLIIQLFNCCGACIIKSTRLALKAANKHNLVHADENRLL